MDAKLCEVALFQIMKSNNRTFRWPDTFIQGWRRNNFSAFAGKWAQPLICQAGPPDPIHEDLVIFCQREKTQETSPGVIWSF